MEEIQDLKIVKTEDEIKKDYNDNLRHVIANIKTNLNELSGQLTNLEARVYALENP